MDLEELYHLNESFDFINPDEILHIYNFWRSKYKLQNDTFISSFNISNDSDTKKINSYVISSISNMKSIHNEKIAAYKIYNDIIATSIQNENEWLEHMYLLEDDFH